MEKKRNNPEVRFTGYTDDWGKQELSKLAEFSKGKGYSKSDLSEFGNPIILYGRLYTNYQTVINDVDTYAKVNNDSVFSKGNEVIVPSSGETQEDIVRASVVEKARVLLGGDLNIIIPKDYLNSIFLALIISNGKVHKELVKKAQGKSVVHIRNNDLQEVLIPFPQLEEQTQIGSFFQNIDQLIVKHQQKLNKLKILKKTMLEKMFPKEGANVPEVRFKGFSEAWENSKVTDLGKIFIGLVTTMTKSYRSKGTLLIRNSDIKDNHFEFSDKPIYLDTAFADNHSNRKLRIGDVVTVHTGDVGTSAVISKDEENAIGFATIITRPNKELIESNYLSIFFNSETHKKFAVNVSTGDGRTNYNLKDFYELVVPYPSIAEQVLIGSFFKKLDTLISNHQTQLTKLSNIKKACLDKMFI